MAFFHTKQEKQEIVCAHSDIFDTYQLNTTFIDLHQISRFFFGNSIILQYLCALKEKNNI